jgi:hypothetical protein
MIAVPTAVRKSYGLRFTGVAEHAHGVMLDPDGAKFRNLEAARMKPSKAHAS